MQEFDFKERVRSWFLNQDRNVRFTIVQSKHLVVWERSRGKQDQTTLSRAALTKQGTKYTINPCFFITAGLWTGLYLKLQHWVFWENAFFFFLLLGNIRVKKIDPVGLAFSSATPSQTNQLNASGGCFNFLQSFNHFRESQILIFIHFLWLIIRHFLNQNNVYQVWAWVYIDLRGWSNYNKCTYGDSRIPLIH